MLKILQDRLQQYVNQELPDVQAGFWRGRGNKDQLPTFVGSRRKQKSSRKTFTSASLITWKPLTVWITTNRGKFLNRGVPDYLSCLLRNLYVGQAAKVRTGHGTMDWFQIGKGVRQGCILSPCLFNFSVKCQARWITRWTTTRLGSPSHR